MKSCPPSPVRIWFHVLAHGFPKTGLTSERFDPNRAVALAMIVCKRTLHSLQVWCGIGRRKHRYQMPLNQNDLYFAAAMQTNSIVAENYNIPFNLDIANDPLGKRTEDAIIAYGWRKFPGRWSQRWRCHFGWRDPDDLSVKLGMGCRNWGGLRKITEKALCFGGRWASKRGWPLGQLRRQMIEWSNLSP